ncbi:MAG: M48 family metallopeptidase [Proteobacteria bacterium]|nr:M48 family metallopeptidase [Pseudomonadota bacterium]
MRPTVTVKFNYYILILLLIASNSAQAINELDLPDIGDSSGSAISPEFERRLGQVFMRSVRQHATIVDDPEVESYIESIGYQLAANSDNNSLSFTFFVVDNPDINAFAAPGGVIGINSGTILSVRSESELAGVLAHEIAHVTQRHMARQFERAGQFSIPATAALLGAILIGIANPEAGLAALTIVTGTNIQSQINFTRANEVEADSVGIQLLARSGYDPQGMPSFFERLQQKSEFYQGNAPEFLRTHPLTSSRIADSKDRASRYPKVNYVNTASYELVRSKIEVNSYKNAKDAIKTFKQRLANTPSEKKNPVRYGYVLALIKAGNYYLAREQLKPLLSRDKENIAYMLIAANIESEQRNYTEALEIFQKAYQLYPDYRPLVLAYAKTLLDSRQSAQARDLLHHYRRQQEPDPAYYDLLAQAEAQNGSMANSGIAKEEYYYLTGDTKLAIDRLIHAKRESELDYYQREKIIARINQLEYELELEEELKI